MSPFRGARLLSRLIALALLAWVSGLASFVAQAAHGVEDGVALASYQDPCEGCPDDEDSALPCSPVCVDCFCGPGTRLTTGQPALTWEHARVLDAMPSADPLSPRVAPPQSPSLDGILRPPRA